MDTRDDELRDLLAAVDPVPAAAAPDGLLDRVLEATAEPGPAPRTWLQRHWQGSLLLAATVATLALATPIVVPGLFTLPDGSDSAGALESAPAPDADADADADADKGVTVSGAPAAPSPAPDRSGYDVADGQGATAPRLARTATLLVGTDDTAGRRDEFVARVTALGGRVLSESVVTSGSASALDSAIAMEGPGASYPYPWYPAGPGVFLTVEVPQEKYDGAVQAARSTGEVVQSQQTSFDVATQITDVDARIAALETSVATLTGLLDRAETITDVVALESALSQRQAELDGLRATQRDLANQTTMSQLSLTLMSPDDARDAVDPQPSRTWWQSFLDGLADLWSWLGAALLLTSPLLLAGAVVWWARRRRAG